MVTEMLGVVCPVDQRTVPVPLAVRVTVELAQFRVALDGLMLTVGRDRSPPTTTLAMAEQPLPETTVTEYGPAMFTTA